MRTKRGWFRKELIGIYDRLIEIARKNIDGKVSVEWGTYKPTSIGVEKLISRRDKLIKGE